MTSAAERLDSELAALRTLRYRVEQERATYRQQVSQYLLGHKMATFAIGAGAAGAGVASGYAEKFTEEQRIGGGIAAAAALIYYAYNMEECNAVLNVITKAAAAEAAYTSRLKDLTTKIANCEHEKSGLQLTLANL